ncbi:helix-turn-helix domain-containing protein [Streptomyces sp. URMC 126]|uniref:helix-turn-helix domain-containing protein n=1 Tax=Streptomyces sp. URMC 126 TaxID=3423401 RepID=UPI003F53CE49
MLCERFTNGGLAEEDRFAGYLDYVDKCPLAMSTNTDYRGDFRSSARLLDLGGVVVFGSSYPSLEIARTTRHIRASDPDAYIADLCVTGDIAFSHAGRESVCGPGHLLLWDSSRPNRARRSCRADRTVNILVQIPRSELPLPAKELSRLLAVPMSARQGIGAVFARWLTDLDSRATEFTAADARALASVTMELLTAFLAQQTGETLAAESRPHSLRVQIRDFIQQRLREPSLSPTTIAAAHHISVRYLHQVFEDQGVTLAAWIRRLRLERCRRELVDPCFRGQPVRAIAARWCFTEPAHFSRVFRAAYGMPPHEYRRQALSV